METDTNRSRDVHIHTFLFPSSVSEIFNTSFEMMKILYVHRPAKI